MSAFLTGITRVSKESVFSDLNNLEVVTTTSDKYAEIFGFTEEEVFAALKEFSLLQKEKEIKEWYDGFTFGKMKDIYNPWSIIHYLDNKSAPFPLKIRPPQLSDIRWQAKDSRLHSFLP